MVDHDSIKERGRALEDEYFRRKDRELIEKIRQAAAAEQVRQEMGRQTGLTDPTLLKELEDLGFTPDTVALLPLMPIIQIAWAEGGVTDAERALVLQLARSRGIAAGSPGDAQLTRWLATRPPDTVFARAGRLIRAMLESGTEPAGLSADNVLKYCEEIAAASGGLLGIGRLSAEERKLIAGIAADLKARHG
jgi:hypothetical protein